MGVFRVYYESTEASFSKLLSFLFHFRHSKYSFTHVGMDTHLAQFQKAAAAAF